MFSMMKLLVFATGGATSQIAPGVSGLLPVGFGILKSSLALEIFRVDLGNETCDKFYIHSHFRGSEIFLHDCQPILKFEEVGF